MDLSVLESVSVSWCLAIVVLCLVNAIDVVLTTSIISQGGKEFNPLIKWLVRCHGLNGLLVFKLSIFLLVILCSLFLDGANAYTLLYLDFVLLVVMCLMYRDLTVTPGFDVPSLKYSHDLG